MGSAEANGIVTGVGGTQDGSAGHVTFYVAVPDIDTLPVVVSCLPVESFTRPETDRVGSDAIPAPRTTSPTTRKCKPRMKGISDSGKFYGVIEAGQ